MIEVFDLDDDIFFVAAFSASKIAKPKAQSEDRELPSKSADTGTVRLQQIGIEPAPVNYNSLQLASIIITQ